MQIVHEKRDMSFEAVMERAVAGQGDCADAAVLADAVKARMTVVEWLDFDRKVEAEIKEIFG